MQGLLVYSAADIPRNTWFIGELCRCAGDAGVQLRLCTAEAGVPADAAPDFVINRSRDAAYAAYCEDSLGIRVYNSAAVTRITNDKWQTHCFLRANGIPTADTVPVTQNTVLPEDLFSSLPLVAKPPDGHGGAGVTWLADADDLKTALRDMPRPFLLQAPMQTGWDLRVYLLGGEIYAAMLRTSETEFRSNFSLGGHAVPYVPDAEIRALTEKVQAVLPTDFAGIDFLRHPDGGYVIGEIEDAVGCRMLYQQGGFDPARDYIRMIVNAERGIGR